MWPSSEMVFKTALCVVDHVRKLFFLEDLVHASSGPGMQYVVARCSKVLLGCCIRLRGGHRHRPPNLLMRRRTVISGLGVMSNLIVQMRGACPLLALRNFEMFDGVLEEDLPIVES